MSSLTLALGVCCLTHALAALASAAWSWHRDWFVRFHYRSEQCKGWELGWGWPEEAAIPRLDPRPIPASPQPPFPAFSREAA